MLFVQTDVGSVVSDYMLLLSSFDTGVCMSRARSVEEDGQCPRTVASRILVEQTGLFIPSVYLQLSLKSISCSSEGESLKMHVLRVIASCFDSPSTQTESFGAALALLSSSSVI